MKPTSSSTAIVTDGLWRKSLSAIRSLGKSGYRVIVFGENWFTTGFWSKFTAQKILTPSARQSADGFGKALMATLDGLHKEGSAPPVLLPMEEPSLRWVIENQAKLDSKAVFLVPSLDSFKVASDKGATIRAAQEIGLPVPLTWEPKTCEEFLTKILNPGVSSFIVKPRTGSGSTGVLYGPSHDWGENEWSRHWQEYGPLLIQERIGSEGRGLGVSVLMDREGNVLAAFAHERLRQYPVSGGPSTDRRSIHDPELVTMSLKLLKRLSWKGIAMVEWKEDPTTGQPKLMEINPRFWGSLELAIRAGVDFPTLYAEAAQGKTVSPRLEYPKHVRCRWLIPGEILRYLSEDRKNREGLGSFLKGLPDEAEEWDRQDLRGGLATIICSGALALHPRYWKYLRRNR